MSGGKSNSSSPDPHAGAADYLSILHLDDAESGQLRDLVDQLARTRGSTKLDMWLKSLSDASRALPESVQAALRSLMSGESQPAVLIRGLIVDEAVSGPTPDHWSKCRPLNPASGTLREEVVLSLLGQALGEIYGYVSLQGGNLIHNIMPIIGAETDQSGHGSRATLTWHTEDAFTPYRADYLGLMGLRNHDGIATTVCGISALDRLDAADTEALRMPTFRVVPDDEHLRSHAVGAGVSILSEAEREGRQVPVLSVGSRGLEMVIDSVYMSPLGEKASAAFARASQLIEAGLQPIPVASGDILLLDNRRAVHGRESFTARFDGNDRWLLKVSIAHSLQPSAAYHQPGRDRVLR